MKDTTYIDLTRLVKKKKRDRNFPREKDSKLRKAWWREKRRKDRAAFDWRSGVRDDHRGMTNEERMRYPLAGWKMMGARMAPGRVYTRAELRGLVEGSPSGSVAAWLSQWLVAGGFVEKVAHPDFDSSTPAMITGWNHEMKNPRWLYRLTEGGCVARSGWLKVLERQAP
jgi:hypothetical protein